MLNKLGLIWLALAVAIFSHKIEESYGSSLDQILTSATNFLGDLQLASTENDLHDAGRVSTTHDNRKPTSEPDSEPKIVDLAKVHPHQVVVGWAAGKNVTVVNSDGSKSIVPSTVPVIFILNEPAFAKISAK